jgi:hypothetical protein
MHSNAQYWVNVVDDLKEKVEEEWDTCNRAWEKINQTIVDLRLLAFGFPLEFRPIEEVLA